MTVTRAAATKPRAAKTAAKAKLAKMSIKRAPVATRKMASGASATMRKTMAAKEKKVAKGNEINEDDESSACGYGSSDSLSSGYCPGCDHQGTKGLPCSCCDCEAIYI